MKIKLDLYDPGEAAKASGRSVDNQRNDRRAGYSPKATGHARYDLLGVSRLFVRQEFAHRGIGPQKSLPYLEPVAREVAFHAAVCGQAWTPRALATANDEAARQRAALMPEPSGEGHEGKGINLLPDSLTKALEAVTESLAEVGAAFSRAAGPTIPEPYRGQVQEELRSGLDGAVGGVGRGILIWANDEFTISNRFWDEIGRLSPFSPRAGAVVTFHFWPMGRLLASRLPRPIFDIDES